MSIDRRRAQGGLTLVELIVFIVIVGTALAGVLSVLNVTVRASADPVVRKQALAIAEALLEEVMLQPFTWCDPDDPNAATANQYGDCATPENNLAPEPGETRGSNTQPWDNVNDYNGLATAGSITGAGTAPYAASVSVARTTLNGVGDGSATSAALLIAVSVTAGNETVRLEGYRTRYAPNATP